MIGVTARALQGFVIDGYGETAWQDVCRAGRFREGGFELMLPYPPDLTERIVDATAERLGKTRSDLLEDLGIYMVSHPNMNAVRRLLRFSGSDFTGFVDALPDLPDRARLVIGHIAMPPMRVQGLENGVFWLDCRADDDVTSHVMIGMIRAMADDYGALATAEAAEGGPEGWRRIEIMLLSERFAEGRAFELRMEQAE